MTISMYQLTIPTMLRGFDVLASYVEKAAEHVRANKIDPNILMQARLANDMLPFVGQIQRASDKSKNGVARLTGLEPPRFEDNETTFDDVQARIAKTVAFLKSVEVESFVGSESRIVEFKARSIGGQFSGETYLTGILLPDFFFHVATAHGILRNQGVQIGKSDYLGRVG